MLTALDSEQDKVRGLNAGADDYLTKPFSHHELIARVQSQLRRSSLVVGPAHSHQAILKVGSITLNPEAHSGTRAGEPIALTPLEFRSLHYLMEHAGRVVPTNELLKQVWGYQQNSGGSDVVRVTVYRLRQKLEVDPSRPQWLHTIPGVGVLLKIDTDLELT